MSEWIETTIGKFCPFAYGKALRESNRSNSGEFPVIGSGGPSGSHSEALSSGPTTVIGRKGSVGTTYFARGGCWPIDTTFFVADVEERDPNYTFYLLSSLGLSSMNSDSAVPGLNRDAAHALAICVPPLDEQRAIAGVLGALDDKIESNRRVVDLVSRLSRAECQVLIRDSPGSLRRLGDVATFRYGKALGENYRQSGNVPVYGSAGVTGYHDNACVKGPAIIVGRKGRPGTVYLSFDDCWPIDTTFWLEALPGVRLTWLYFAVEGMNLGRFGADSAVPGLNREMAERDELYVPDEETQGKIEGTVWPILERRRRAETENGRLIAIRDALLPELLSGRLRVRDAEKVVEDVV